MIYLDNCSTTKMRESVLEIMKKALEEDFFNPSALYNNGYELEKRLEVARKSISKYLNIKKEELIFTSGATESNNLAINMAIKNRKRDKNHIITSNIEHSSIKNYMDYLEDNGFKISYINVDSNGIIDPIEIKQAINSETFLISIGHVNNEIGTIQDINNIGKYINEDIFYHIDGVQALGKIPFNIKDSNADFYTFSGHKIHGPKGIGGLYINSKNNLKPVVYGGKQEFGFRSGTENYPAIIALEKAISEMYDNYNVENLHIKKLKKLFLQEIKRIKDIKINSKLNKSSPYIINISIEDIMGEVLLNYLADNEEIFISTASACSANSNEKSHVIRALNLNENYLDGTIRICLSYDINEEDIIKTVEIIEKYVNKIREITRR